MRHRKFKWLQLIPLISIQSDDRILDVDVNKCGRGNRRKKLDRINALPDQVTGIEIESKLRTPIVQGVEGAFSGVNVKGDLCRDGLPEANRTPHSPNTSMIGLKSFGKKIESGIDHARWDRRKRIQQVPNAASGESIDDFHTKFLCGTSGVL